jgi:DNA-binding MarR family transcriptional regulator
VETSSSVQRDLNLAQLFRIPFQSLVVELHNRLAEEGFADIRPPHTSVFAHIGLEGIRLTDLAERSQLTKQLMNYLVNYLDDRGYVFRTPDPVDRRAKIIRLTERGEQALRAGSRIIRDIEMEWMSRIGEKNMELLRGKLELLVAEVGPLSQ